ncbi:MAG: glycolate oxidase subunit GlcE [Burkholderiaceae bacterium]
MTETQTDPALLAIRERIRTAAAERTPLALTGGGTKAFYGEHVGVGLPLDLRDYRGIVSYEPTELVVTARCGTPLAEVQATLAEHGQWLACEPPRFGEGGTVGGMVAAGLSGPGRAAFGSVRDFVLGARMIDARGQWLAFGGQVMKNVAGYDISRLLCGSLGVLGPIVEVSLKVLPLPACERSWQLELEQGPAIRFFNELAGRPLPVTATAWLDGRAHLRLAGAEAGVRAAETELRDHHGAQPLDDSFWRELRDHRLPSLGAPLADGERLWRLSLPSSAAALALPGQWTVEWGGALRWLRTDASEAAVRAAARAAGGSSTRFRGAGDGPVFEPLPAVLMRIHKHLKTEFDPLGLFNPGRLVAGL